VNPGAARCMRTTWIAGLLLLVFIAAAQAQGPAANVTGAVRDNSAAVLPGAEVTLVTAGAVTATVHTGTDGRFALAAPAGTHTLRVRLDGFEPFEAPVAVTPGAPVQSIDAVLALASFADTIVVTGSRAPEALRVSPVAITVVRAAAIETSPATNYADLLRGVPGVNAIELSARDVQLATRTASGRTARTTLALLDGRSMYQDYFGMVLWDLMPVGFDEIKQVEVLRGPGSALWGANALTGVINVITKSPREMAGTRGHIGFGGQRTREAGLVHAGVRGDVGYKLSASYFGQDHWDRPLSLPDGTPLPPYANQGTDQVKLDARVEFDGSGGRWRVDSGMASSGGLMLVAVGPFEAKPLRQAYGSVEYVRGTTRASVGLTGHTARYTGLLSASTTSIDSQSLQADVTSTRQAGTRHVLTYGGTAKASHFDLNFVPDMNRRAELGLYLADDFFLSDRVRIAAGTRVDWFDSFGVFASPRVGLRLEPGAGHTFRATYNRAYVAPSMVENGMYFPSTTVLPLPTGNYDLPILSVGDPDLAPQTIDAIEGGYTGALGSRLTVGVSVFRHRTSGLINLLVSELYSPQTPPAGWPLPPALLATLPLPKTLTWTGVGSLREWGAELTADGTPAPGVTATASYSYQGDPVLEDGDGQPAPFMVNRPPRHRVGAAVSLSRGRALGSLAIASAGRAFWTDVLAYTGYTERFTQVNALAGIRFHGGRLSWVVRGTNLANRRVQQHLFGDIIGRRVITELRFAFQEGT
jgi:outer membrane receptor protein involved in Fe transport